MALFFVNCVKFHLTSLNNVLPMCTLHGFYTSQQPFLIVKFQFILALTEFWFISSGLCWQVKTWNDWIWISTQIPCQWRKRGSKAGNTKITKILPVLWVDWLRGLFVWEYVNTSYFCRYAALHKGPYNKIVGGGGGGYKMGVWGGQSVK